MTKLFAIFRKELLLKFSSPAEWLYFIILPVVFAFIIAGGTGGSSGSAETRIRLLVTDLANSPLSASLIQDLSSSAAVFPEVVTLEEGQRLLKRQSASAQLIIPADFGLENALAGNLKVEIIEQPNNLNALAASQAVSAVIARVSGSVAIANQAADTAAAIKPFASPQERSVFINEALAQAVAGMDAAPVRMTEVTGSTIDPVQYDPHANSSAGQMITWVFIPLFGLSAIFAGERLSGTLRRLVVTPSSRAILLFGVIFSNMIFALVQMILLMLFGKLVMGVDWFRDPLAIGIVLITSILAAAAIGTTLGTFVKTESQASGLSIMMGMVMALLGGCWYPMELFPTAVQTATLVLPTRWAMQGMLDVLVRGQGAVEILPVAAVLLGFAAIFFVIGILRFKYE